MKEKIKEFRSDAQTLDKNLQGDGGGKFTGGGDTKVFGQVGTLDKKAHLTFKQPPRYEKAGSMRDIYQPGLQAAQSLSRCQQARDTWWL